MEIGALSQESADKLKFERFDLGNVSRNDLPEMIFLKLGSTDAGTVVACLSGSGQIHKPGRTIPSPNPPRDPADLKP